MPTYVYLVNLTEKGKSDLDQVRKNGKELLEYVESIGGKNKGSFMTLGRYDIIRIIELPDDFAALKLSMKSTEKGYEKVETLKGFTEKEASFGVS